MFSGYNTISIIDIRGDRLYVFTENGSLIEVKQFKGDETSYLSDLFKKWDSRVEVYKHNASYYLERRGFVDTITIEQNSVKTVIYKTPINEQIDRRNMVVRIVTGVIAFIIVFIITMTSLYFLQTRKRRKLAKRMGIPSYSSAYHLELKTELTDYDCVKILYAGLEITPYEYYFEKINTSTYEIHFYGTNLFHFTPYTDIYLLRFQVDNPLC